MKNAKKLMLLLLSLVLLVGVFAVATLASEPQAQVLTVQYPDGTVETYAEGQTVAAKAVPAEFVAMSEGKGYKFTVAEGAAWEYSEALPETVTAGDLGKTITATIAGEMGTEQVLFTMTRTDKAGEVYYGTTNIGGWINKWNIPAPNGFTANITLYADVTTDTFNMGTDSSGNTVKLDLNGYNVTVEGRFQVSYAVVYIYSSKPGANFYSNEGTAGVAFSNDSGTLNLGDDGSGNYVDNIAFHGQVFMKYLYGKGGSIIGGHFYQTAADEGFIDIARRVSAIRNASFYLAPGTKALFISDKTFTGDSSNHYDATTGAAPIDNCKFYAATTTPVLYSTTGAKPVFTNCEFYNVTATNAGTNGKVTADASNTFKTDFAYNTITWQDGSVEYYVPASVEAAKLYIESSKKYIGVGAVAPYGTVGADGLYYAIANPNLTLTFDGLNAVFTDSGERVRAYYSIEHADGTFFFNTDAANYQTNLKAYFGAMIPGEKVTLWSNAKMGNITFQTKRLDDKATVESAVHYLDLNGYTLTITGNADSVAMKNRCNKLFVYSTREGAEIIANGLHLFLSDNDEYQNTDKTATIKPLGKIYIGDSFDNGLGRYAKNLTAYCDQMNEYMYGSQAKILGGTYIQSAGSQAEYFLLMSRTGSSAQSHVQNMFNATIVLTNPNTTPLYYHSSEVRTFTNCTFISCNEQGGVALSCFASPASGANFDRCNFVNVLPVYGLNGKTFAYNTACKFGTTGLYSTNNLATSGNAKYLAHSTAISTITANGKTYTMDGAIISDPATALLLTREGVGTDLWMVGTTPSTDAGNSAKFEGGILYKNPYYDYSTIAQLENGVVKTAGTATAKISYAIEDLPAFIYVDNVSGTLYGVGMSECADATAVGLKFAEIFNAPTSAYTITMYTDMYLTKAITFGENVPYEYGDGYNRDYYNSLAYGAITWDLNGHTVTIDKECTYVNLNAANHKIGTTTHNGAFFGIIALEGNSANVLTIKSSVAGGKFVNLSPRGLFAIGEGSRPAFNIDGANLTVESAGYVFYGWSPAGGYNHYTINGGTYIYTGGIATLSKGHSVLSGINTQITNATFICTKDVEYVIGFDAYRKNVHTFDNCAFYAPNAAPLFKKAGTYSKGYFAGSSATVNNCTMINAIPTEKMIEDDAAVIAYTGKNVASTKAALDIMYATAPAGEVAAYYFVSYNGAQFKVIAYTAAANAATVNWGFGETEVWVIGETATHANVTIDGVFTYGFEAILVAEGENNSASAIVAIAPGAVQMYLVLQSKIGLNVLFAEELSGAIVRIGGTEYVLADLVAEEGFYKLDKAIAPNVADEAIALEIVIGDNVHALSVSIGKYAKAILADAEHADAHNLTYAMVEYVRVMADSEGFLASVAAPAGYAKATLVASAPANEGTLLDSIAFQLDGTIAIAVHGANANGMAVTLKIGAYEATATVTNSTAIFEGLYVNEFIKDMTISIEGETYSYNLSNYLNGLTADEAIAGVQALYNYAFYADAYVKALQGN